MILIDKLLLERRVAKEVRPIEIRLDKSLNGQSIEIATLRIGKGMDKFCKVIEHKIGRCQRRLRAEQLRDIGQIAVRQIAVDHILLHVHKIISLAVCADAAIFNDLLNFINGANVQLDIDSRLCGKMGRQHIAHVERRRAVLADTIERAAHIGRGGPCPKAILRRGRVGRRIYGGIPGTQPEPPAAQATKRFGATGTERSDAADTLSSLPRPLVERAEGIYGQSQFC